MLPQLDCTTYSSQLFWLLINFIILYNFISGFVVPKLDDIVRKRSEILDKNKYQMYQNYDLAKLEGGKYKAAISKANSLSDDIRRDNHIMIKERDHQIRNDLKEKLKVLNAQSDEDFQQFKSQIQLELIDEVVNIISLYYQQMVHQKITRDEILNLLKGKIEEEL